MQEPQLFLYVISVFLSERNLDETIARLRSLGLSVREGTGTDQTGKTARTFCTDADGVRLLLTDANGFHRDGDFEIGFTTKSLDGWERFLEAARGIGLQLDTGTDESDGSRYAIPKTAHCPFFFLFDGTRSDAAALTSVRATMTPENHALYDEKIRPLLEPSLAGKMAFSSGAEFLIHSVQIVEKEIRFCGREA